MNDPKIMEKCDVCLSMYQQGPHVYGLRINSTYGISVCSACHNANWDGWGPLLVKKVTANLVSQGKPLPARLANGLLPRE